MNGKFLLDTSIVIDLFANDPPIIAALRTAGEVFLSSTVLGELHYGALKSQKPEAMMQQVRTFAEHVTILSCDSVTAHYYAHIKIGLQRKGRPIPENDIWIAAIALQYQLVVATRDKHFGEVDGLVLDKWQK